MAPSQSGTATTTSSNPNLVGPSLPVLERLCAGRTDSQLNALAGAFGGLASGVATCPLDVIKTKLQAQSLLAAAGEGSANGSANGRSLVYRGLTGTARTIWYEDGFRGFYRGLGPIVLGYIPTWAVYFTVYGNAKSYISRFQSECLLLPWRAPFRAVVTACRGPGHGAPARWLLFEKSWNFKRLKATACGKESASNKLLVRPVH